MLITGGAVVLDSNLNVTSTGGVFTPILQAEDGTYFGTGVTADNSMDAFDLSGNVKWSVPGYTPVIATADGGVIAQSSSGQYETFDQNGAANGMLAAMPTYSWTDMWYSTGSTSVSGLSFPPVDFATSFQTTGDGNPSSNGTSVAYVGSMESRSVWARFWKSLTGTTSCSVGTDKVALAGDALQQYTSLRQEWINGNYPNCTNCKNFFDGDPARNAYLTQLSGGVSRQVPYDGLQTNISMYDAGMVSVADMSDPLKVKLWKLVPVCGNFETYKTSNGTVVERNRTTAASQLQGLNGGPATDIYINTNDLKDFSQGTILHEALHNLTGMYDDDLEKLLGLDPKKDCSNGTTCITKALVGAGCAGTD